MFKKTSRFGLWIAGLILGLFITLASDAQPNPAAQNTLFPILKDGSPSAYVAFTQPKQTHGLAMVNPDAVEYSTEVYLGKLGAKPKATSKDQYFYFQAATDQLVTATGTFYVTVHFLDKGQGALSIEYMSQEGESTKTPRGDSVFLGNSGIWQQHSFTLTNAIFDHSFEGETDFRLLCSGIMIHAVMLTRLPVIKQDRATSSLFRQTGVLPPPGYEIGLMLTNSDNGGLWSKDNIFKDKCNLYQSWGVSSLIDTIDTSMLITPNGTFDFAPFLDRVKKLEARGLKWSPRFKIGDPHSLPSVITETMHKLVGTDRPKEGPMISIWEPRLVEVYAKIFDDLHRVVNPQQVPRLILSFAGDWGPLFLSMENDSSTAWPDFWAGGMLAQQSFQNYLMRRYGNINGLRNAWKLPIDASNSILPSISSDFIPIRNLDTYSWYRESFTAFVREIINKARIMFPLTEIVMEISDDFGYSATDPTALAAIAAENHASMVMVNHEAFPTISPNWLCFANSCQRRGVKFGLRAGGQGGSKTMLPTLYSLASEGGSIFYFSEGFLIGEDSWTHYAENIGRIRPVSPNAKIALIYPRTSITMSSSLVFQRICGDLRDLFGFDVVDEEDIGKISATDYPFIFVPWGKYWTKDALISFDRLARSGAALVVQTDEPWETPQGNVEINEQIFAVELQRTTDGWRYVPRTQNTDPYQKGNPIARLERRLINVGEPGDDVFLQGQWGDTQNEITAKKLGFSFPTFRWMGERGQINLPMIPGKEYELQLDGFIPAGKRVQVYINQEYLGGVVGNGPFQWKYPITGKLRTRSGDVNVLLRGQLWSMGEVLGATQSQRVSLALSKVSVVPRGEKSEKMQDSQETAPRSPDFARESLRGSWMREVGQGVTVLAPLEYVNEWVYREMLNSFVMRPAMLDPRFRFSFPPDGEKNEIFVKPLSGGSVYLNLNDQSKSVGGWDRFNRSRSIPPQTLYYSN